MLNTYRVWLIYESFRGSITGEELNWSEIQIRDFVATRKSGNTAIREERKSSSQDWVF